MTIKELRLSAGLTQKQLAEQLSVERSTVSKWETGEASPRAEVIPQIAKTLHCSVDDLFGNTDKS